jgi:hypothetical protein
VKPLVTAVRLVLVLVAVMPFIIVVKAAVLGTGAVPATAIKRSARRTRFSGARADPCPGFYLINEGRKVFMNKKTWAITAVLLAMLAGSGRVLYAQELTTVKFDRFDKAVKVDSSFAYYISLMNTLAEQNNVYILVQGEGFRRADAPVRNAIVPPSATSNHLVGHAVDINIRYNGKLYNSTDLGQFDNLPQAIKNFINGCKSHGMRWGGDFSTKDPVHFDDGLNLNDKSAYDQLYLKYQ